MRDLDNIKGSSLTRALAKQLLASPDKNDRAVAAWQLGHFNSPQAAKALLAGLRIEQEPEVIAEIIGAMGWRKSIDFIKPLTNFLRVQRDPYLRKKATWALGELSSTSNIRHAIEEILISDSDPEVRSHAAWILGKIRDPGSVTVLEHALFLDPDPKTRRMVIWALSQIDSVKIAEILSKAAFSELNKEVKKDIIWRLGQYCYEEHLPKLISLIMMEEDLDILKFLVRALLRIESPEAEEQAYELLSNEEFPQEFHHEIIWNLSKRENHKLIHRLVEDWNKKDKKTKKIILQTLIQLSRKDLHDLLKKLLKKEENKSIKSEINWVTRELKSL